MLPAVRNLLLNAPVKTSFELALKTSLVPKKAVNGTPTLTRSSTKTVVDFEGLVRTCKAGEVGIVGARRVENTITNSSELTPAAGWTLTSVTSVVGAIAPDGTNTAYTVTVVLGTTPQIYKLSTVEATEICVSSLWIRRVSGTGDVKLIADGGTHLPVSITSSWRRYSRQKSSPALSHFYCGAALTTVGDVIEIWHPMLENVSRQTNQNPSEYVSSSEMSAGALGVKYFPYLNGNTVADNVVTEGQGAAIPEATLKGDLIEGARTNIALWNRDLTNAAWVAITATVAKTAAGIDGAANAASTLTATGTDSTVLQTVTLASSVRVFQPYIKRVAGTGAISITTDNGTTWTDVTAQINASTYTQVQFSQTVTNPVFGFKIATSSDVIAVDYADNQGGAFASSPIPTTTAAVTRAADVLSYPTAGNLNAAAGGIYLEFTPEHAPSGTGWVCGSYIDANNYCGVLHDGTNWIARKRLAGVNYDATITASFAAGIAYKIAMGWGNSGVRLALAGAVNNVVVPGPELIVNGGFDTDTVWNKHATVTISGGAANFDGATSVGVSVVFLQQEISTIIGMHYTIAYTVIAGTTNAISWSMQDGVAGAQVTTAGTYISTYTATSALTTLRIITRGSVGIRTGGIDNISFALAGNTNSSPLQLGSTIQLGADGNGGQQCFGEIANIKFFKKELKTSKLIALAS